ncbi:carbohydrate ABC transporter permease [Cellulomonas alba]|uniref:Carbohydrate ABC transporter permease n=1 Tax=Cellulomonas alba TaxID=3053467 RepID=A0ABT7SIK7_9CELL|nr:carbohydrate ABC transporter permease [Cellulomonas alba]MDM7856005.1 carbohydrate ABC transporter permease [Cellulomonas alba]
MTTTLVEPAAEKQVVAAPAVRRRRRLPFSGWHFFLLPTAVLFLVPLVQMILASVSPAKELAQFPRPLLPSHLTLAGFRTLFTTTPALHWLLNSAIVALSAIIAQCILCSLAGYGFARLKFKGRNVSFFFIIATIMIPTQVLMVPTYMVFSRLGLLDGLGAAIVPWLAGAFGIFLMRQFFLSIPKEMEEAAALDGCGRLQIFFRVVLPLAKPALATLAIFTLLGSWNDLVWPLIAINNESAFTIQLGIANFQGTRRTQWELLMAANVVATAPLIAFFLAAQRHFIATMTLSGVKG